MWFMNNIANPLVRLILRSPLHGLMSAALLLITYRGRKSGKAYTLPVQYAQDGNTLYIIPGAPEQKNWWRNLQGCAPVQVTLRGKTLKGDGSLLDQNTQAGTIAKGLEIYLKCFPTLANSYQVHKESDGRYNSEELQGAAAGLVMVRVELKPE